MKTDNRNCFPVVGQIEYSRTVVPSSMRSPYWKYFGFPSDDKNKILTRQKIVCSICNTAIAYNKNTSNLRTHLMSRHAELMEQIMRDIRGIASSTKTDKVLETNTNCLLAIAGGQSKRKRNSLQRIKIQSRQLQHSQQQRRQPPQLPQYTCNDDTSNLSRKSKLIDSNNGVDSSISNDLLNEPKVSQVSSLHNTTSPTYAQMPSNTEIGELSAFKIHPDDGITIIEQCVDSLSKESINDAFVYVDVDRPLSKTKNSGNQLLADMLIADLLPPSTVQGSGFSTYLLQVAGVSVNKETLLQVMEILQMRYERMQRTLYAHLRQLSHKAPYSLSVERYDNIYQQSIINIYYNFYNNDYNELISVLLYNQSFTESTQLESLLNGFNLRNCAAIVVPDRNDVPATVQYFVQCYELEVVEGLESVLQRCLQRIFDLPALRRDFSLLYKLSEEETVLNISKPTLRPQCCWSKLNYLQFFRENHDQNEDWLEVFKVWDFIKPLRLALNIIAEEPLPLCSLIRPLIVKLFEEHFGSLQQHQSLLLNQIKIVLEEELKVSIMQNGFLNEATFFDARFHHDFALQDMDLVTLKNRVCLRFKHLLQDVNSLDKNTNTTIKSEDTTNKIGYFKHTRKSSLKSFFCRVSDTITNECRQVPKSNIDLEFEWYKCEPSLDLDHSPIQWWLEQSASRYKYLQKIALFYLCTPCCVNNLYRLDYEQLWLKLEQRKHLSQHCNIERHLWYMYYNQKYFHKINQYENFN